MSDSFKDMYQVVHECGGPVYCEGSYDECKDWLDVNYDDELLIISCETGRAVSVVWGIDK